LKVRGAQSFEAGIVSLQSAFAALAVHPASLVAVHHPSVPEAGTIALNPTCAECGRSPQAGETWRILFADIGEAVTYCPECPEREFGHEETA
jgi:hypothetical protein